MAITVDTAKVYRSSKKGRRYLTLKAAIHAEAVAIISNKYPRESPEFNDNGMCSYGGYYWREDIPRSDVLLRRLSRIVRNSIEAKP